MGKAIGVQGFDYRKLLLILNNATGGGTNVFRSLPTITIGQHLEGSHLAKTMRTAGFEVVFAETGHGEDDSLLIEKIRNVNKNSTDTIVMVSADQDYIPILRARREEGIAVYFVATQANDVKDGRPVLGQKVLDVLSDAEIRFVELSAFVQAISLGEVPSKPQDEVTNFSMRLDTHEQHPDKQAEIMLEIRALSLRFPGLRYRVL